jgi:hypothetical protein
VKKLKCNKPFSVLIATLLLASMILVFTGPQISRVSAPVATGLPTDWPSVYFCTDTLAICNETYPMEANVSDTVTFALVVFNLTAATASDPSNPLNQRPLGNLIGFDVQMSWNPSVLNLTSCTVTSPWNDFQTPVSPSPYAGVLYAQIFELANQTDQGDSIPGAESGTMLWRGYSSMNFTTPFNGNGTFLITTFKVIGAGSSLLSLTSFEMANQAGKRLLWHQSNGYFHTPGAPKADFNIWPNVGVVNKTVIFNASASNSPLNFTIANYTWNFGDSNITVVTDSIVYHTYTTKQTASVSLTVTDNASISSSPKTVTFSVVDLRNVKVTSVTLGQVQAVVNRTVDVTVTVNDDGEADENGTAAAYYNTTVVDFNSIYNTNWTKIDEQDVSLTTTHRDKILSFAWNTTGVPLVNASYYIMANVTQVPYEKYTTDNNMTSASSIYISDTAIDDVAIEQLLYGWEGQGVFEHPALDGETSKARVTVHNVGTEDENVTVIIYRNGTVWQSWNQTLLAGKSVGVNASDQLAVGFYNLTAVATIPADVNLANNRIENVLAVIALPHLNFTYAPKPPIVNQTAAFDASQSYHGQSGANITSYKWQFFAPGASSVTHIAENITVSYALGSGGSWRVILSVTDSYGIGFRQYRPRTQAYILEVAVAVEEAGGFPIEYLLAVVIIVVVIAALAVVLIRRRRARKT